MNKYLTAKQIRRFFEIMTAELELDDAVALEIPDLYEPWQPDRAYNVDTIVKYGKDEDNETQLWRILQSHTSQSTWTPDSAASLYKRISFDGDIPIWVQPLGAGDSYNIGDRVSHNGSIYVSIVDSNVWEPGVYGWEEDI